MIFPEYMYLVHHPVQDFLSSTQMHICTYICLHNFSTLGFLHCHLGLNPQNRKFAKHKNQFLLLLWLQHPVLATLGLRSGSAEGSLGLKPGCRCRCLWWPLSSPPLSGMTSSSTPTILLWMVSYMTASTVLVSYWKDWLQPDTSFRRSWGTFSYSKDFQL